MMPNRGAPSTKRQAAHAKAPGWNRQLRYVLLLLVAWTVGCGGSDQLDSSYGQRRGRGGSSIGGTRVLAGMFEEAGFNALTWRYLSGKLEGYDVIVWAPDDFESPGPEQREFLETWLENDSGRTLVYIGRDFDATSRYWGAVLPSAPADQYVEINRRLARAQAAHDDRRMEMPEDECVEWFSAYRDRPKRRVTQLDGPWSKRIDAAEAEIWIEGRMQIPGEDQLQEILEEKQESLSDVEDEEPEIPRSYEAGGDSAPEEFLAPTYETLLRSDKADLAFRVKRLHWGNSQIIVVANGSFLLNLPLVNHQHRLLAGELIRECGMAKPVAFLESGPNGVSVHEDKSDAKSDDAKRKRVLLAAHWFALGIIFCFFAYPIFGRPKEGDVEEVADFGQHIDAYGELLEKTKDAGFVRQRLQQYSELTHREPNLGSPAFKKPPVQPNK